MAKKNIGEYRLCLLKGVELQDSHFLPSAVYKAIMDRNSPNPNPVVITPRGVKQTSYQQTAPLLCRQCEQRFSERGENWTLAHFLRGDGTFVLADILRKYAPAVSTADDPTKIYLTAEMPEIDSAALIYFAASMFGAVRYTRGKRIAHIR